ncbi:MAG: Rieske 2Fe-2S domain-containing protein [Chloroflexota bacterium]
MLLKADNETLCRVGAGTPMGELFRRFWLPALLARELPQANGDPVRVRLLGEDLIAFRDTSGTVAILGEHCPHRGASLFFGRNEENGLRCVYHGWKFDATGQCVDMPNEPAGSTFTEKVRHTAYPTAQYADVIWIYMGPPEHQPELPKFEWAQVPSDQRHVSKWVQHTNWLQGMEGEIYTSHISFLHSYIDPDAVPFTDPERYKGLKIAQQDGAPRLTLLPTDYGFVYGARRNTSDGEFYWRVTQWLLPMYSLIPSPVWPRGGRAWVPIDDEHTWTFGYSYNGERPLSERDVKSIDSGAAFPPRLRPGTFEPLADVHNDYLIDRAVQRTRSYTGIWGINDQDRSLQESMGPILNREIEHLGSADLAVIQARRILLRALQDMQTTGAPPAAATSGEVYRVRAFDIINQEPDFGRLVDTHRAALVAPI